jgi:hypothetical protein
LQGFRNSAGFFWPREYLGFVVLWFVFMHVLMFDCVCMGVCIAERRRKRKCVVMCSFSIMIKLVLQVLKPVAESEGIVVHVLEGAHWFDAD